MKLPANMKSKGVKFEALGKHVLEWYIEHGRKDVKSFRIRMNFILGEALYENRPHEVECAIEVRKRLE